MSKYEQFFSDVRKELSDVRKELDAKIGNKASLSEFRWVMGILVLILMAVVTSAYSTLRNVTDKVIAIETKISERKR